MPRNPQERNWRCLKIGGPKFLVSQTTPISDLRFPLISFKNLGLERIWGVGFWIWMASENQGLEMPFQLVCILKMWSKHLTPGKAASEIVAFSIFCSHWDLVLHGQEAKTPFLHSKCQCRGGTSLFPAFASWLMQCVCQPPSCPSTLLPLRLALSPYEMRLMRF